MLEKNYRPKWHYREINQRFVWACEQAGIWTGRFVDMKPQLLNMVNASIKRKTDHWKLAELFHHKFARDTTLPVRLGAVRVVCRVLNINAGWLMFLEGLPTNSDLTLQLTRWVNLMALLGTERSSYKEPSGSKMPLGRVEAFANAPLANPISYQNARLIEKGFKPVEEFSLDRMPTVETIDQIRLMADVVPVLVAFAQLPPQPRAAVLDVLDAFIGMKPGPRRRRLRI